MPLTAVQNLQLHNQIERVLHVPGNYRGGILEMAVVIDRTYEKGTVQSLCADIIASCKKQSEVFRNVRLNMVMWGAERIRSEVVASAYVQMGTYFDNYEREDDAAHMPPEEIMEYLKKFHARSKLILLLTPDRERMRRNAQTDRLWQAMNPFLKQKLVLIYPDKMESGTEFLMR